MHTPIKAQKREDTNAKIKAVFIYNFTKYIEWPKESSKGSFKIGVYENKLLYDELVKMSQVKRVANRTIDVTKINDLNNIKDYHIIYINTFDKFNLAEAYISIGNHPVLLVTSTPGLPESMINFREIGKRQKFELNKAELERQNLIVSPVLKKLAILVESNKKYPRISSEKIKVLENKPIVKKEELSNEEFDALFIEMQKELESEKKDNARKDQEIYSLKSSISELETKILLKETELKIVQNRITEQEKKLEDLQSSIGLQEEEYLENKMLAAASRKDLEKSRERLQNMKDELKNINHLLDNQKLITYLTLFVLLIIAGLGFTALKNYKKQKVQASVISRQKTIAESQRDEIQTQHLELEEKNREITDSITYAKRIQEAILPPLKLVQKNLENSFIFYLPKDIVAGDFYWMEAIKDEVIFAAADCTGHGVPGAMVSVVCSNALNRSVREYGLTKPSAILDKTLEIVIERFEKSEEDVKDGMDIALCSYNPKKQLLNYSGAHNPLWVIRKGSDIVEEIKADKQPIGMYAEHKPFTNHEIQLSKGNSVYIFSDGYVDQFGGERGKKFKSVNFKKLLLSIQEQSIDEQYAVIKNSFQEWKQGIEQLDDVCVIGFRA